ncbi:CAP domain-containing protein [Rhodovulum visakhapatnamense]|uniref:CAP domain-containing protein n=2 Tax=Rhodovulum visakhapatnamense TaxID=364297 RepID=A0ABS1RAR1_9RHOB|nr:CAP domain-containing protein [Rhodovulum visakhapatnamense]MBL3576574.1 CAP domain-containing protein [Rhodovulum visakhapatnamense]
MIRPALGLMAVLFALSACSTGGEVRIGPDGKPLPTVYRISRSDQGKIQYRMLDSINALRQARGLTPLELDSRLNAAAATHSRDMSVQNRPWHFGSDGSSPLDRVARAGYQGQLRGEDISETYETELETLAAWMEESDTRNIILDPQATDLGFAFYQEMNGKIWWTLVTGQRTTAGSGA